MWWCCSLSYSWPSDEATVQSLEWWYCSWSILCGEQWAVHWLNRRAGWLIPPLSHWNCPWRHLNPVALLLGWHTRIAWLQMKIYFRFASIISVHRINLCASSTLYNIFTYVWILFLFCRFLYWGTWPNVRIHRVNALFPIDLWLTYLVHNLTRTIFAAALSNPWSNLIPPCIA